MFGKFLLSPSAISEAFIILRAYMFILAAFNIESPTATALAAPPLPRIAASLPSISFLNSSGIASTKPYTSVL